MASKRCAYCGALYRPHPRTAAVQKACRRSACRKARKREADRQWRRNNPGWSSSRQAKVRQWAKDYPGYWSCWRACHPAYRARERLRMSRKRAVRVAKQDAIRQDPVGYLAELRSLPRQSVAKQDAIGSQIDGILDFLAAGARVAKPNDMAPGRPAPLP